MPTIRELSRDELAGLGPAIADLYLAAFSTPPHHERPADAAAWLVRLPTHAARPGFRFLVADDEGTLAGFAYGYTGGTGQWWTDLVTAGLPPETRERWFDGHFEVVDLAVAPAARRRGIGRTLLRTLLDGRPELTAALSTEEDNADAIALYRSEGWTVLREGFAFPDSPVRWLVFVRDLTP